MQKNPVHNTQNCLSLIPSINVPFIFLLENLSVREVEALIRNGNVPEEDDITISTKKKKPTVAITSDQFTFKEYMSDKLSAKVELSKSSNGAGKIIIPFNSEVDLNRIIELINK